MKKLFAALALTATIIAGITAAETNDINVAGIETEVVEARAWSCTVTDYIYNGAFAKCYRGNYGDVYAMKITCKKNHWFGSTKYTKIGTTGYVGYVGSQGRSAAICAPGYYRSGGGTIWTP